MRYCFDTSALLTAWRRNYPPDVFPSLWSNLVALIESGNAIAPDEVRVELERKDDEVLSWARQRPHMFYPINNHVQQVVRDILRKYPRLVDTRKNRSGADPFVIALAIVEGCTVVTNEGMSNSPTKPNIPDVCDSLKVHCIDMVTLARTEKWKI